MGKVITLGAVELHGLAGHGSGNGRQAIRNRGLGFEREIRAFPIFQSMLSSFPFFLL